MNSYVDTKAKTVLDTFGAWKLTEWGVKLENTFGIIESYDSSGSFSKRYKILASNMPEKIPGDLGILFEKVDE
jgi:hypothetical protein